MNKKEKKKGGLTYAPVTLLVIALPVVMVPGMGVAAAEVVRMNEKKGKGDSPSPLSSPYPLSW